MNDLHIEHQELVQRLDACSPLTITLAHEAAAAIRSLVAKLAECEANKDQSYQDAFDEGYREGQSDASGAQAHFWNMMLRHYAKHNIEPASDDGEGYTAHAMMDALYEYEHEREVEAKKTASGVDLRVVREAYEWVLDGTGQLYGLTRGDQGYEPSGIVVDAESMKANRLYVDKAEAERDEARERLQDKHREVEQLQQDPLWKLKEGMRVRAENAEFERDEARALLREAREGLGRCARVFEHYANLHAAKGTPEADAKADSNRKNAQVAGALAQKIKEVL